jgi:hypothetical protein
VDGYRWYADCDGDGYAPTSATTGAVSGCTAPMGVSSCSQAGAQWVTRYPIGTGADCDDVNSQVYPNAFYETSEDRRWGYDYNCDTQVSKQYTSTNVVPSEPCTLNFGIFCSGVDGYTGDTVPECGQTAELSLCSCTASSGGGIFFCSACGRVISNTTAQGCR